MLVWKKETYKEVLFETSIDKTKVTFMLKDSKVDMTNDTGNSNITERLTVNQKKIIETIIANPYITSEELSKIVGIIPVNIRRNISKLKDKGILSREGADKGGKWIVIK